jgi:hypothetical protein
MNDALQHRLMCAADNLETLGNGAHDPTLTTTACAAYGKLIREAIEGAAYAEQCVEALRLAKAWIEHCDRDGTMEEQIARADAYNAKYPEKTFWTPDYDRAARAIVAALSKNSNPSGSDGQGLTLPGEVQQVGPEAGGVNGVGNPD